VTITIASQHAWFNGEIVAREVGAPSIASGSLHLGTGVFDGLVGYRNDDRYYIHKMEEHLARFRTGAYRMGLNFPWTVTQLADGIIELLRHEPPATQYIRPIAYRKAPELWVTGIEGSPVDVSIFTVRMPRDNDSLLSCHLSSVERISSRSIPQQTKVSGAYVNSFNARKTAEQAGFDDGVMLDRQGRIAEASAANLFTIRAERLLTPALNPDVFPGITRQVILDIAKNLGIEVTELDMYAHDLDQIEGAFLCSTFMEVRGLSRFGNRPLQTAQCAAFMSIVEAFRKITHQ
jgi:branched-chain amino acid aminotransferase